MLRYPFPKVELHIHLDGSFRHETVWELVKKQKVTMPANSLEEYKEWMKEKAQCGSVNEYLTMFDAPLQVMQDRASLSRVTKELIEDLAKEGIAYAEIRFAPQLHTQKEMTQSMAVEAVLQGREEALKEHPEIQIGILTCMMCVGPETANWDQNAETVEVCKKYLGKGVVGIDLAGAEGIVPLSHFAPLFERAKELGIPRTCHAGDSPGPETVYDAIMFGAQRIGHGHHAYRDLEVAKLAAEKQIPFEICPTSNIQCQTQPSYQEHPAKKLLDMGVPVTISVDNETMAGVSLEDEYDHCINDMGFTEKDLIQMNINAIKHSFCSDEIKKPILEKLESYL